MAKTTKPLTNTEVKQARPSEKEYNLSDGQGLALRVKTNGTKQWLFNYSRPFTKKRSNISFGIYPDISLSEARIKRFQARNLLANDIDPKEHKYIEKLKQKAASENTLKAISQGWFDIKSTSITPSYADDIWRSLELHIFPKLGKVPIHKIEAPTFISLLQPVAAKGSLETVKRLCQRINEIMTYAVNSGLLEGNKLTGVAKAFQAPKKKNLPTLKPGQLKALVSTIKEASIKTTTKNLILWQLHTMVRPSEAAGTKWIELDEEKQLWNIPADRMKRRKAHIVPITDKAMAILQKMKLYSGQREFVFPADRDPRKPIHPQTANMALKRMGYKNELVAHGLRALASTTLNEANFSPDIIETALAHYDKNEVRRAYNRAEYIEKRKDMMEWWSNQIEQGSNL